MAALREGRRHEAREIADDSTSEGDDQSVTIRLQTQQLVIQCGCVGQRLALFAGRHDRDRGLHPDRAQSRHRR